MRTTLDIDEKLVEEAREMAGAPSKKAVIEEALREFINARKRQRLLERIGSGDIGIDMTLEELFRLRGCDKARAGKERWERLEPDSKASS